MILESTIYDSFLKIKICPLHTSISDLFILILYFSIFHFFSFKSVSPKISFQTFCANFMTTRAWLGAAINDSCLVITLPIVFFQFSLFFWTFFRDFFFSHRKKAPERIRSGDWPVPTRFSYFWKKHCFFFYREFFFHEKCLFSVKIGTVGFIQIWSLSKRFSHDKWGSANGIFFSRLQRTSKIKWLKIV